MEHLMRQFYKMWMRHWTKHGICSELSKFHIFLFKRISTINNTKCSRSGKILVKDNLIQTTNVPNILLLCYHKTLFWFSFILILHLLNLFISTELLILLLIHYFIFALLYCYYIIQEKIKTNIKWMCSHILS